MELIHFSWFFFYIFVVEGFTLELTCYLSRHPPSFANECTPNIMLSSMQQYDNALHTMC